MAHCSAPTCEYVNYLGHPDGYGPWSRLGMTKCEFREFMADKTVCVSCRVVIPAGWRYCQSCESRKKAWP